LEGGFPKNWGSGGKVSSPPLCEREFGGEFVVTQKFFAGGNPPLRGRSEKIKSIPGVYRGEKEWGRPPQIFFWGGLLPKRVESNYRKYISE